MKLMEPLPTLSFRHANSSADAFLSDRTFQEIIKTKMQARLTFHFPQYYLAFSVFPFHKEHSEVLQGLCAQLQDTLMHYGQNQALFKVHCWSLQPT